MFNRGSDRAVIGIALFLMIAALANNEPGAFVLLAILAVAFAFRNAGQTSAPARRRRVDYPYDEAEYEEPVITRQRPANVEQIHQHALQAVRRANLDPNDLPVLPVDIGFISFRGDDNPTLHRTMPVDDDVDYIQPFVQIRIPRTAAGRIKFEIFDHTGQKIFAHEDNYQLQRGRNLVIPSTRLPIHDEQEMDGRWELRITAGSQVLARHVFEWANSEGSDFQRHIGEDGEISSELRAVLAEARLQQMSLDELLAHQEDNGQQQMRQ